MAIQEVSLRVLMAVLTRLLLALADFEVTLPVDRLEVERGAGVDPKIVLSSTMFLFFSPNLGDPVTLVLTALGELDVGGQLESEASDSASAKIDAFVGVSPVFF